ncbi:NADH-quinone oxidoreductase subunit K [Candidatus Nitrospira bockiana]
MEAVLAVVIGVLYAGAMYLLLRRSVIQLAIGFMLLNHATNLLLFTIDGVTRATPPIVPEEGARLAWPFANPLSQALILTAIVIGFGLLAFTAALIQRTVKTVGADDVTRLQGSDR